MKYEMKPQYRLTLFAFFFNISLFFLQAQSIENDSALIIQRLEIVISCDKTEFIQGQLIDILVNIKNNSNDTIALPPFDQYLYSYKDAKTYKGDSMGSRLGSAHIPPFQEMMFIFDPLQFINHKEEDKGVLPNLPWY